MEVRLGLTPEMGGPVGLQHGEEAAERLPTTAFNTAHGRVQQRTVPIQLPKPLVMKSTDAERDDIFY